MKSEDHDALRWLLEDWFRRQEAGERPEPEEHCGRQPDLLPAFRRLLRRDAKAGEVLVEERSRREAEDAAFPPQLGGYDLLAPIGSGGCGQVCLARDRSLGRLVALKIVRTDAPFQDAARRRLRREAEIAASLDHPGIVPVYGVGEEGGRTWIAMKWLSGPALDALAVPLPGPEVARIGAAAARALHAAHEAGVIHRDVKPSNVMFDQGRPCLLDFGLARSAVAAGTTQDGRVAGTLQYMSPEQLRSGSSPANLDARTDIYSLGATLYELAAGSPPFASEIPGDLIRRILLVDPRPLPAADRDLVTIILRTLEKDRDRRFPTARGMAEDLERYLAGRPIESRPVGLLGRGWKLTRRHPTASLSLAAAVLSVFVFGGSLWLERRRAAEEQEASITRVRTEIESDRLRLARSLFDPLAARDPENPTIQNLGRTLRATELLDELLDLIQDRPEAQHPEDLCRCVALIVSQGAMPSHRERAWRLSRAAASFLAGGPEAALPAIEALSEGRARSAFLGAAGGAQGRIELPPAGPDPMEHLFTALAFKLAGRPAEDRRAEIEAGRKLHETDWRLLYQEALLFEAEGEHAMAYRALQGLLREGSYPRSVRRGLLREAVVLDRRRDVEHHLDRFQSEHPREIWTAADAWFVVEAQHHLGLAAPETGTLAWARGRWPLDSQLAMQDGRRRAEGGDLGGARKALESARDHARDPRLREDAALEVLRLVRDTTPCCLNPVVTEPGESGSRILDELAEGSSRLADATERQDVRIAARLVLARALLASGDGAGARQAIRELGDPPDPALRLEASVQAFAHYQAAVLVENERATAWQREVAGGFAGAFGDWSAHARRARELIAPLLSDSAAGIRLAPRDASLAWVIEAGLAFGVGEFSGSLRAIEAARRSEGAPLKDWQPGYLEAIEGSARERLGR